MESVEPFKTTKTSPDVTRKKIDKPRPVTSQIITRPSQLVSIPLGPEPKSKAIMYK